MNANHAPVASPPSPSFSRAWVEALARLWLSLESVAESDASAVQILRLELHLLHTTVLRLRRRRELDSAHELRIHALVDELMMLSEDAPARNDWRMRVQNRLFDEVVTHVAEPLPMRRAG